jgi:hypothetical protein
MVKSFCDFPVQNGGVGLMVGIVVGMMVGLAKDPPSSFPLFTRVSED